MANNQLTTQLKSDAVKQRFAEVLGDKANGFVASMLSVVNNNNLLSKASFDTVYTAAMKAATLDLPIEPSLGFAYIVPYKGQAQFQIGYKGLIQLALRSGQVKKINAGPVYQEQFISYDPLFEELEVDFSKQPKANELPVGYFATLQLTNGFKKLIYWTRERVEAHGKKYSQSYNSKYSPWQTDFDAMARKTLLKSIISTYAPLSTEMRDAIEADNKVVDFPKNEVKDVTPDETIDAIMGGELNDVVSDDEVSEADPETGEIAEEVSFFEGDTTKIAE